LPQGNSKLAKSTGNTKGATGKKPAPLAVNVQRLVGQNYNYVLKIIDNYRKKGILLFY